MCRNMFPRTLTEWRIRRSERKAGFVCETWTDNTVEGVGGVSDWGWSESTDVCHGEVSYLFRVLCSTLHCYSETHASMGEPVIRIVIKGAWALIAISFCFCSGKGMQKGSVGLIVEWAYFLPFILIISTKETETDHMCLYCWWKPQVNTCSNIAIIACK